MKLVIYKIIILIILISTFGFSSNKGDNQFENLIEIEIKNGKTLKSNINPLYNWGFYLDNGDGISYRVIKIIKTKSKEYIKSLQSIISNLNITQQQNTYLIDFTDANLPIVKYKKKHLFQDHIYLFNIVKYQEKQFEFQLQKRPTFSNNIICQLSVSNGRFEKEELYHDVLRYSCGAGFLYPFKNNKLSLLMNASIAHDWLSLTHDENAKPEEYQYAKPKGYPAGTISEFSPYLSILYQYNYPFNNIVIDIGTRYFFSNKLSSQDSRFVFHVGIGWKIDINKPRLNTY